MSREFDIPAAGHFPATREEIERRAYEIYLARGGQDGNDVAHWIMAEQELMGASVGHVAINANNDGRARDQEHAQVAIATEPLPEK
jgi:hypothetical protein